jgi:hypothetical protein
VGAAANSKESAPKKKVPGRPFVKGQSGNLNGRPKQHAEYMELMRSHLPAAIKRLHELSEDGDVTATVKLVEWGLGKPSAAPEDREAMKASVPFAQVTADDLLVVARACAPAADDED